PGLEQHVYIAFVIRRGDRQTQPVIGKGVLQRSKKFRMYFRAAIGRRRSPAGEYRAVPKVRVLARFCHGLDEVVRLLRKDVATRFQVLVDAAKPALLSLVA